MRRRSSGYVLVVTLLLLSFLMTLTARCYHSAVMEALMSRYFQSYWVKVEGARETSNRS